MKLKKIIKHIIFNRFSAKLLIRQILRCHSFCYFLAGQYAGILNNGIHPKHYIMKYKEWFADNIEEEWTVLDVGCNTGMMPVVLEKKANFVYGIEINQEHVRVAENKNLRPNIKYICADATTYDYSSCKPIDCITMSNVLEHIEHRVDFLKRIIQQVNWKDQMHRRVLFRVPMIDREWIVLYKKELGLEYRLDPTHYTEYTFLQFKEELKQASIIIQKAEIRFGEIYAVCEAD
ncbi:Methyltransferase domain-containing protein [Candidatus Magnetomoraceae bacterium gMMP-1]